MQTLAPASNCASWIVGASLPGDGRHGRPRHPERVSVPCPSTARKVRFDGGAPSCERIVDRPLICGTPGGGSSESTVLAISGARRRSGSEQVAKQKPRINFINDCGGPCPVVEESYPLTDSSNFPITTLSETAVVTSCDAKGICKATAELNPDPSVCDAFGEDFVDFTADDFIATVNVSIQTIPEPTLYQYCQLNGNAYDCTDLTYDPTSASCGSGGGD